MLPAAVQSETTPKPAPAPLVEQEHWHPTPAHRYRGWRLRVKRLTDVVVATVLTIALTPVLIAIGLLIRATSRGPALFRQRRVGHGGQLFTVLKFRTMVSNADSRLKEDPRLYAMYRHGGFKIALDDDPRVTPIGRFLRRTSLDELPQLLNIMWGQMSLVGPRPVVPDELDEYGDAVGAYLMAIPGLTGAWQVSGRDDVKFPERAQLDVDYINRWSLLHDVRIMLRTVPATLAARGVE